MVLFAALLTFIAPTHAQTPTPTPDMTASFQAVAVHSGPGDSFQQVAILNPGVPVRIIERNRAGTWLHLQRTTDDGTVAMDGWVLTGYLTLDPGLQFSQVTVNTTLLDGDPAFSPYQVTTPLFSVPVIPQISDAMRQVYQQGQALGNHANVVTKIGDSLSANDMFLTPMSHDDAVLGPFDYLADTIAFFGPSLAADSAASRIGMTTYTVFDPMWADDARCRSGETPLDCEYRLKQPAIAMIVFGPNDVRHMTAQEFDVQMRMIVANLTGKGVIPVLTTFSADPNGELWWQSVDFNRAIAQIGADEQVPVINLWLASRPLPAYGLDQDQIHMLNSGFTYLKFDSGNESWYGVTLENLLSIDTLDEIRRTLNMV